MEADTEVPLQFTVRLCSYNHSLNLHLLWGGDDIFLKLLHHSLLYCFFCGNHGNSSLCRLHSLCCGQESPVTDGGGQRHGDLLRQALRCSDSDGVATVRDGWTFFAHFYIPYYNLVAAGAVRLADNLLHDFHDLVSHLEDES